MDDLVWEHPQNPYDSYLVQASAGSGKTYQLSKRYMNLVASGVHPARILTITFTVKAASEMRARIISEASQLLVNETIQESFDGHMEWFFSRAQKQPENQQRTLPPPLSGHSAARMVLASTQMLKIMTIDALFREWTGRFPFESGSHQSGLGGKQIAPGYRLCDQMEIRDIDEKAWQSIFMNPDHRDTLKALWRDLREAGLKKGPLNIRGMLEELYRLQTFLWSCSWEGGDQSPFRNHVPGGGVRDEKPRDLTGLFHLIGEPLAKIAGVTKRASEMLPCIREARYGDLISLRLLTRENRIHGGTIRGKKREQLADEIFFVEEQLADFFDRRKIRLLNQVGSSLFAAYEAWIEERERLKLSLNLAEFSDLTSGCYQLFHQDKGVGAVWQIQQNIRHLMFDEFQDTSLTQWGVFSRLTTELLSGEGASEQQGLFPTAFIVGDLKQSVYGFREADPYVMTIAEHTLSEFNKKKLPLNKSFRTAQLILDFVNRLFSGLMESFPEHRTATSSDGSPFIPDQSRVFVRNSLEGDEEESGAEKEATFVAEYIRDALNHSENFPVFEKDSGTFRPLKAKDCCILYRNATHAGIFEKALRKAGLPYRREEKKGYFERSEIQDMVAFFRCLLNPADPVSLLTLMKSPVFGVSDTAVAEALTRASAFIPEGSAESAAAVLEAFSQFPEPVTGVTPDAIRQAVSDLLPHQILAKFYRMLNVPDRYEAAFPGAEGIAARRNLVRFVEVCSTLEDQGYVTLSQCLRRLEEMIPFDEWAPASGEEDVVSLMTIHKAKGLEFPLVMVIEADELWYRGDRYWLQRKATGDHGVSFIGSKSMQPSADRNFSALLDLQLKELEKEAQRLLYVALTRASQYLVVSGHKPFRPRKGAFLEPAVKALEDLGASVTDKGVETERRVSAAAADQMKEEENTMRPQRGISFTFRHGTGVPVETDIVQPHAGHLDAAPAGSDTGKWRGRESRVVAATMGTFIHKGLESHAGESSWNPEQAWQKICEGQPLLSRDPLWKKNGPVFFSRAMEELYRVLESQVWSRLLQGALEVAPEKAVVSLSRQKLIRGQADLFLRYKDHIKIVDYKTGHIPVSGEASHGERQEVLKEHCRQQGYRYQLSLYSRSFRLLYPGVRIFSCVLFTKSCDLVSVDDQRDFLTGR